MRVNSYIFSGMFKVTLKQDEVNMICGMLLVLKRQRKLALKSQKLLSKIEEKSDKFTLTLELNQSEKSLLCVNLYQLAECAPETEKEEKQRVVDLWQKIKATKPLNS